jgi:hypothetical protein
MRIEEFFGKAIEADWGERPLGIEITETLLAAVRSRRAERERKAWLRAARDVSARYVDTSWLERLTTSPGARRAQRKAALADAIGRTLRHA